MYQELCIRKNVLCMRKIATYVRKGNAQCISKNVHVQPSQYDAPGNVQIGL